VRSSAGFSYLTMWFSIGAAERQSSPPAVENQ
jgi:hypothetical protein